MIITVSEPPPSAARCVPDEPFLRPDFLGDEVTGDRRYYNAHLRQYPYSLWRGGQ